MRYLIKRLDTNEYQTLDSDVWGDFEASYAWHDEALAEEEALDQTAILRADVVVVTLAAEKKARK